MKYAILALTAITALLFSPPIQAADPGSGSTVSEVQKSDAPDIQPAQPAFSITSLVFNKTEGITVPNQHAISASAYMPIDYSPRPVTAPMLDRDTGPVKFIQLHFAHTLIALEGHSNSEFRLVPPRQ